MVSIPTQLADAPYGGVAEAYSMPTARGHPQHKSLPDWSPHRPADPQLMAFDTPSVFVHDPASREHALWADWN